MADQIIKLPFAGFYHSLFSDGLDLEEEQTAENMAESHDGISASDIACFIYQRATYRTAFQHIAQDYAERFNDYLKSEYELDLGLRFEKLDSPKEYNFTTDRVFCYISEEKARELFNAVSQGSLADAIRDRFTPRSGFIPYYSNDLAEWLAKPIGEWDHNELETLLVALLADADQSDCEMAIYQGMRDAGVFYDALDNAVDWAAVESDIAELKEEINRAS
jgi:hypothetical protein